MFHATLKFLTVSKAFVVFVEFYCKCHDEQFHFINPQDDMIEKTLQVVIIRRIQVIRY